MEYVNRMEIYMAILLFKCFYLLSEVAQSCPTLRDPMDCSLPGSSVHGIFQARVLEWGAISFSKRDLNVFYFNHQVDYSIIF